MDVRELGFEDVDWFHMAQNRDRWRALVNTVMNFRVSSNSVTFLSSQGGVCCMALIQRVIRNLRFTP
jgi:hypothetical protein